MNTFYLKVFFKRALVSISSLTFVAVGCLNAETTGTTVNVYLKNGLKDSIFVKESGRIFYQGDTMYILSSANNGSEANYLLADIRKLTFRPDTSKSSLSQVLADGVVVAYPNPTTDEIRFTNLNGEKTRITITDQNGRVVFSRKIRQNEAVNVSSLAKGIYVLDIDGHKTKLMKR